METTYKISLGTGSKVDAHVRNFIISTDQPASADGGDNSAPTPFELFLASLGTCAGYYVLSFCRTRGIPTGGIGLTQTVVRNDTTHMVEKITIGVLLPPDFPEKYRDAVIRAADSCAVKKHLASPPVIEVHALHPGI
jgi:ribosomal protein S12 methylthiotransferase accessory factor